MICDQKVSLVTTCMGRADHLEQSIPTWLACPIDEIIIVDWSSPGRVKEVFNKLQDGRLIHARVPDKIMYDRPRSRNLGIRLSSNYFIIMCDVDVKLSPKSLNCIKNQDHILYLRKNKNIPSITGTCIATKYMLSRINGYNERLQGYGFEDNDLFDRLHKYFKIKHTFDGLSHIDHSWDRSIAFESEKDRDTSRLANKELAETIPWTNLDVQEKLKVFINTTSKSYEAII